MQLSFQQPGAGLNPMPDEIQRTTIERNRLNNAERGYRPIGKVEWLALRRKLDRLDPSYEEWRRRQPEAKARRPRPAARGERPLLLACD